MTVRIDHTHTHKKKGGGGGGGGGVTDTVVHDILFTHKNVMKYCMPIYQFSAFAFPAHRKEEQISKSHN